jgi:glycolate oxidase iron-sulfur subunit
LARQSLADEGPNWWRKRLIGAITNFKALQAQMGLLKFLPGKRLPSIISTLLSGQSAEADRPNPEPLFSWPELVESELPSIKGEVCLLEGCAMRVLFPNVHIASRRLLRRMGLEVLDWDGGCCGALHAHNGFLNEGKEMASKLSISMPTGVLLIVNSAGCGSHLKDLGVGQIKDISEFLFEIGFMIPPSPTPSSQGRKGLSPPIRIAYHDACHLAHGQGIRNQPRKLLESIPGVELVPLHEADMCCGSAGIYNLTQPKMARDLLERKWSNIEATGCDIVALANPGCHSWIAQAAREKRTTIRVRHIAEVLECALSGLEL